jgi:hypothetical protein
MTYYVGILGIFDNEKALVTLHGKALDIASRNDGSIQYAALNAPRKGGLAMGLSFERDGDGINAWNGIEALARQMSGNDRELVVVFPGRDSDKHARASFWRGLGLGTNS